MDTYLPVEQAQKRVLEPLSPLSSERVSIEQSLNRVLAEDILSSEDSPPFDNSAMDGYAVRFSDLGSGAKLKVRDEIKAGDSGAKAVEPGTALRIFTGAPMPEGADTVVMQEHCALDGDSLEVLQGPTSAGANVRRKGSNIATGEIVLDLGHTLEAGDIGLLASFRIGALSVFRQPRVAILTSGDELQEIHEAARPGSIVNSNAYMLDALVRSNGGQPCVFPIVPDDLAQTIRSFEIAAETSDLVLSSGGASVGDHDHVRKALEAVCEGIDFWKIKMKPGKPLVFGVTDRATPILGLPGNPVSSFVGFHQFVRPALAKLQGKPAGQWHAPIVQAVARYSFASSTDRFHFVTGNLDLTDSPPSFAAIQNQSSSNLGALAKVNALARCPVGITVFEEGDILGVDYLPL